jgi:hypothetical protein
MAVVYRRVHLAFSVLEAMEIQKRAFQAKQRIGTFCREAVIEKAGKIKLDSPEPGIEQINFLHLRKKKGKKLL